MSSIFKIKEARKESSRAVVSEAVDTPELEFSSTFWMAEVIGSDDDLSLEAHAAYHVRRYLSG